MASPAVSFLPCSISSMIRGRSSAALMIASTTLDEAGKQKPHVRKEVPREEQIAGPGYETRLSCGLSSIADSGMEMDHRSRQNRGHE
ncbi:hypothetical protein [Actinoplanes sp. NPDC089786]|uniref:hypothetical protein n=1 Tax=Actinoplanes sp. NPDC089786 TaxID=3155185 RepID=UPI0034127FE5